MNKEEINALTSLVFGKAGQLLMPLKSFCDDLYFEAIPTDEPDEFKSGSYVFKMKIAGVELASDFNKVLSILFSNTFAEIQKACVELNQHEVIVLLDYIKSELSILLDQNISSELPAQFRPSLESDSDNALIFSNLIYKPNDSLNSAQKTFDPSSIYRSSVWKSNYPFTKHASYFKIRMNELIEKVNALTVGVETDPGYFQKLVYSNTCTVTQIETCFNRDELLYFFRLLIEEDVLIIPKQKKAKSKKSIFDVFLPNKGERLTDNSISSHFADKNLKAVDKVHEILIKLAQRAHSDLKSVDYS